MWSAWMCGTFPHKHPKILSLRKIYDMKENSNTKIYENEKLLRLSRSIMLRVCIKCRSAKNVEKWHSYFKLHESAVPQHIPCRLRWLVETFPPFASCTISRIKLSYLFYLILYIICLFSACQRCRGHSL